MKSVKTITKQAVGYAPEWMVSFAMICLIVFFFAVACVVWLAFQIWILLAKFFSGIFTSPFQRAKSKMA
jgi:hypothetical protein